MQINTSALKLFNNPILLVCISMLLYGVFAYDLERSDTTKLFTIYCILFVCFYKIIKNNKHNIKLLTWIAFVFRAVFILAVPNLSQDFYRFIWDGYMTVNGINPYLYTPEYQIGLGDISTIPNFHELYKGMGSLSASHYSNYPPINQSLFVLGNLIFGKSILSSIIGLRLLIILADLGTLYYGKKLLKKLSIPEYNIYWYLLNPLILIELTGNLHFEGVMLFFLIWSIYLLHLRKWKTSAIVFALSVSTKLIPLIFLPLLFQKLGWKRSLGFCSIVGLVTLLLFMPFYSNDLITNYFETLGLWFQKFEFNASVYYIIRAIGYWFSGYNLIAYIGVIIPFFVLIVILILAFLRKNKTTVQLITVMLLGLSFYYFTATTVHPWYIGTLLILSIFTNYKFPLVWSFVIILSYLAYANSENQENLWIIALEYLVVYGFLIWELFFKKSMVKTIEIEP